METIGQARLLASNKVIDRVKEDLIKTWPRSALLGCAADGFDEGVAYERRKAIEVYRNFCPSYKIKVRYECGNHFHRQEWKTTKCDMNCEYMKKFMEKI